MKIKFENFAQAGNGTIELNDLTITCGPDNTGKTYLNYAIFSILEKKLSHFDFELSRDELRNLSKEFISNGKFSLDISERIFNPAKIVKSMERKIKKEMPTYINLPSDYFCNSKYYLEIYNINDNIYKPLKQNFRIHDTCVNAKYDCSKNSHIVYFAKDFSKSHQIPNNEWTVNHPIAISSMTREFVFDIIFRSAFPTPFLVTSELTGFSTLHPLPENENANVVEMAKMEEEANGLSQVERILPTSAAPIQESMKIVHLSKENLTRKSFIAKSPEKYKDLLAVHSELLDGGKLSLDSGILMYHPDETDETNAPIPLNAIPPSLKSLIFFDIFIKHIATQRHILIIDKPELNLHPVKQALMARLVARLVNAGVKVLITTHSDYFIRELNNSVMLKYANRFKSEVMQKYGYCDSDILDYKRISAYTTTKSKEILQVPVNKFGIDSDLLNKIIIEENNKTRDIRLIMKTEGED